MKNKFVKKSSISKWIGFWKAVTFFPQDTVVLKG